MVPVPPLQIPLDPPFSKWEVLRSKECTEHYCCPCKAPNDTGGAPKLGKLTFRALFKNFYRRQLFAFQEF